MCCLKITAEADFQESALWGYLTHLHESRGPGMFMQVSGAAEIICVCETRGASSLDMASS